MNKILVVDDDVITRIAMKTLLEDMGYCVVDVSNGQEALMWLKKEKFDVLITDINMPIMDGFELANIIRHSNETFRFIPIVGISASVAVKNTTENKLLMNVMLNKPISLKTLRENILSFLPRT